VIVLNTCLLPWSQAAVLGFVGSPWTLATYLIEGGSTPLYKKIKAMTAAAPDVLSALLQHLAVQIAEYMCFQARWHIGPWSVPC
jgi:uroporphyrinogen decarboxylase